VQEIRGTINPGEVDIFVLSGLKQARRSMSRWKPLRNLDPVLSLVPTSVDLPELIATYRAEVQRLAQTAAQPLVELPALNDKTFLAWDDDSGKGYNAALEFIVPQDGDYFLGASGRLQPPGASPAAITACCWG